MLLDSHNEALQTLEALYALCQPDGRNPFTLAHVAALSQDEIPTARAMVAGGLQNLTPPDFGQEVSPLTPEHVSRATELLTLSDSANDVADRLVNALNALDGRYGAALSQARQIDIGKWLRTVSEMARAPESTDADAWRKWTWRLRAGVKALRVLTAVAPGWIDSAVAEERRHRVVPVWLACLQAWATGAALALVAAIVAAPSRVGQVLGDLPHEVRGPFALAAALLGGIILLTPVTRRSDWGRRAVTRFGRWWPHR